MTDPAKDAERLAELYAATTDPRRSWDVAVALDALQEVIGIGVSALAELDTMESVRNRLTQERDAAMESLLSSMRHNSIATGHGDSIADLIGEYNAWAIETRVLLQRTLVERDEARRSAEALQGVFTVSDEEWEHFIDVIDNPAGPTPALRELLTKPSPWDASRDQHKTIPLKVWVDVDEGIAAVVVYLNTIPGVRTIASCQGTIGEGGPAPYKPQVMASWTSEALVQLGAEFDIEHLGYGWGRLYPREDQNYRLSTTTKSIPDDVETINDCDPSSSSVQSADGSGSDVPSATAPEAAPDDVERAREKQESNLPPLDGEWDYKGNDPAWSILYRWHKHYAESSQAAGRAVVSLFLHGGGGGLHLLAQEINAALTTARREGAELRALPYQVVFNAIADSTSPQAKVGTAIGISVEAFHASLKRQGYEMRALAARDAAIRARKGEE